MHLIRLVHGMWQMKWRCLIILLISIALAVALTFNISLTRGTLSPRPWGFGVAQTQLLVDSGESPLADITVLTQDVDLLAGNLAETTGAPQVIQAIARSVGVPSSEIAWQAQLIARVPVNQSEALEAERGSQVVDSGRHYSILVRVDSGTFVVQIFTQAPTTDEAVHMANAAADSLSNYIARIVRVERIRKNRSVILRQIAPASGGAVAQNLSTSVAATLSVIFFVLGTAALFAVRRWRAAWAQHGG